MNLVREPFSVSFGMLLGLCPWAKAKPAPREFTEMAQEHFEQYCFDCHDGETKKGNLDLTQLLERDGSDGVLVFENLITPRMPAANKKQPKAEERQLMLPWLAEWQKASAPKSFRQK